MTLTVQEGARLATAGASVNMSVTASGYDRYALWVANWCKSGSVAVSGQFAPVQWSSVGSTAQGSVAFETPAGVDSCTAYVFQYPTTHTPLKGSTVTY